MEHILAMVPHGLCELRGFIWGKGSYGGRDQETGWLIGLALELKMA